MPDQKRPPSTTQRLASAGRPEDFIEAEVTTPGAVSFRSPSTQQRRIATPLGGGELRAGPTARGDTSSSNVPIVPRADLKPPPMGLPLPGRRPPSGPSLPLEPPVAGPVARSAALNPPLTAPPSGQSPIVPTPGFSPGFPFNPLTTPSGPPQISSTSSETRSTMTELPPGTVTGTDLVRVHKMPPPEKIDSRMFIVRAPDSAVAASFRVLRHRLLERPGLRVIAVTSPRRAEGKTTVALNVALALGEAGRARVLLLEANLRQPSLANALGFRPPVCFGEQLEFHRTHPLQPWVVAENFSPYLHVAAVAPDATRRALVDGPAIGIALEQLRGADYNYIVIDCPPVLGSADVNLIEEHVDGVLFAMWLRNSRMRMLRRAIEQIGRVKVLGSVLVGTK